MHNFDDILKHILAEPESITTEATEVRQQQLLGMIKLAMLLWLPSSFIDALDEYRHMLINKASRDPDQH